MSPLSLFTHLLYQGPGLICSDAKGGEEGEELIEVRVRLVVQLHHVHPTRYLLRQRGAREQAEEQRPHV